MTLEQFRQLFLTASEVPAGMRRTHDTRRDPQAPGEAVWMAREGHVWRLVDRRRVGGSLPAAGQVVQSGPGFRLEEGPDGSLVAHFQAGGVTGTLEAFPEEGKSLAAGDVLPLLERAVQKAGGSLAPAPGPAPTILSDEPAPAPRPAPPAPTEFSPEPTPTPAPRPDTNWAPPPPPRPQPVPDDKPGEFVADFDKPPPRPRRRSPVGPVAAALLAAFLLVGLVAGGAGYLWWSHRPFCGEKTPAADPRMAACKERLATYGDSLLKFKRDKGRFPVSKDPILADSEAPLCPITGDGYKYFVDPETQAAILFCPGWGHCQGNRVAYDFASGKVVENGLEPPAGTWLHYRWATDFNTPESWRASLQDLAGWKDDPEYLGELKADALNNLDRFQEAVDVLKSTQPAELSDGASSSWATAMRGLGRYQEALGTAERQGTSIEGLLFLMGNIDRLMPLAREDEGIIPDWFLSLVPLAQRDYPTAFKEAQRYLESAGYSRSGSTSVAMIGIISGVGLKTPEGLQTAREMMRRALHEAQRDPLSFPYLQVANNELTVDEAVRGLPPGPETTLRGWIGCLREVQGRPDEARALFEWVRDKGSKYEVLYRVSVQRLEGAPGK